MSGARSAIVIDAPAPEELQPGLPSTDEDMPEQEENSNSKTVNT